MISRNGSIALSVCGLVLLQGAGMLYFGTAFWPAVLFVLGGTLAWAGFKQKSKTGRKAAGLANMDAVAADRDTVKLLKARICTEVFTSKWIW